MSDEELSVYIPARGDRLALRTFRNTYKTETRKQKLFDNLRQKMKLRSKTLEEGGLGGSDKNHLDGNKNAAKATRKLELGWIHEGKQVRKKNGGGTRNLEFPKTATKAQILEKCTELFFPNGSAKGLHFKDLAYEILDFKETPFPDDTTVGELYDELKMGILRFYLSTRLKEHNDSDSNSSLPDPGLCLVEEQPGSSTMMQTTSIDLPDPEMCQSEEQLDHSTLLQDSGNNFEEGSVVYCQQFTHQQPLYACYQSPSAAIIVPEENVPGIIFQTFEASSPCTALSSQINPGNVALTSLQPTEELRDTISSLPITPSSLCTSLPSQINPENVEPTALQRNEELSDSRRPISPHPTTPFEITVHRVNIIEEMVNYFKNKDILTTEITFKFIGERGSDQKGVSREVYTAFWTDFLTGEAEGEESRVPAINTKWQEEEWNAVGRILLKGLTDHAVFPLQLNKVFVVNLIHGEEKVDPEMLVNSFLTFICHEDKELVLNVLENGVNTDTKDDFIDMLDRFGCKAIPMEKEKIKCQVIQIAHNQLIQRPKYALDKMKDACQSCLKELFPTILDIDEIYASKKPTTKRVLGLLEASPTTPDESKAFAFLQRFIRAQNELSLKRLLWFITGADTMCVGKITVSFVNLTGISRRVIAHTCGPTIELPATYQSYPEFRRELENQLACEESFRMDIA